MRATDTLYLSGWSALGIEERDDWYLIQAAPSSPFSCCPYCGKQALVKHGTDHQQIKDLPIHGKSVVLCIDHRRYRCTGCQRTCYQPLEFVDAKRQMTLRLVRYIERKAMRDEQVFRQYCRGGRR